MSNKFFICRHCKSVMGGDEKLRELDDDGLKQSISLSKKIRTLSFMIFYFLKLLLKNTINKDIDVTN